MKKYIWALLMVFLVGASGFSDGSSKSYLTEEIINNFISNFEKIDSDLANMGDADWELYFEQVDEIDFSGSIEQFETVELPPVMNEVFEKYGLGSHGLVAYFSIFKGLCSIYSASIVEEAKLNWAEFGYDPEYFWGWKDIIIFRIKNDQNLYRNDLEAIYANQDKLIPLFENPIIIETMDNLIRDALNRISQEYTQ